MSDLIGQIVTAQRDAGEKAVISRLAASGLMPKSEAEKLADANQAAHDALNAAERAWYEFAGLCDVGPERIRAFDVYETVRCARRL